jgi:hypothetical protein
VDDPLRKYLLYDLPKQAKELERQKAVYEANETLRLEIEADRKARNAELEKGVDFEPGGITVRATSHKKPSVYEQKDNDFRNWIAKVKPNLEDMTWKEIHAELKTRNSGLWASGFPDWKKNQNIHKKKPGRKTKR